MIKTSTNPNHPPLPSRKKQCALGCSLQIQFSLDKFKIEVEVAGQQRNAFPFFSGRYFTEIKYID